jgi:hypothetical protein
VFSIQLVESNEGHLIPSCVKALCFSTLLLQRFNQALTTGAGGGISGVVVSASWVEVVRVAGLPAGMPPALAMPLGCSPPHHQSHWLGRVMGRVRVSQLGAMLR